MHNKTFGRDIFNKYFIGGMLLIFVLLATIISLPLNDKVSGNVAHAEDEIPTKPSAQVKYGIKTYDEANNLKVDDAGNPVLGGMAVGSFVVDAYESNWKTKILQELVIFVDFIEFAATKTTKYYRSSSTIGSPEETTVVKEIIPEEQIPDKYLTYGTGANTFQFAGSGTGTEYYVLKDVSISGTTWYGEILKNVSLASANSIPAGDYSFSSVDFEFSYTHSYTVSYTVNVLNATQGGGGSPQSPSNIVDDEIDVGEGVTSASCMYPSSETDTDGHIALTSRISVDIGDAAHNNLFLNSVYNPSIVWYEHIKLQQTATVGDVSSYYFFSYNDNSRNVFSTKYGFSQDLYSQDGAARAFNLNGTLMGKAYHEYFDLNWYYDDQKLNKVEDTTLTNRAGAYYLFIEVADANCNSIFNEEGKNIELLSIVDNSNHEQSFMYEFVVDKKLLKVDISLEMGAKIINNSLAFTTDYMLYSIPREFIGKTIKSQSDITGLTFYTSNDNGQTFQKVNDNTTFNESTFYYVDSLNAASMFSTSALGDGIWSEMGGYIEDANWVDDSMISFNNSHFDEKTVGKHNRITLYMQIANTDLSMNYALDLGKRFGESWISYADNAVSDTDTYLLHEYHDVVTGGEIYEYSYYYSYFEILPPAVSLNFSNFVGTDFYGAVRNNDDIDYDSVSVSTDITTYDGTKGAYNVITSETNWYVKIISDMSEVKNSVTDNYVYIYLTVANRNYGQAETNFSLGGMSYEKYTGTLYAGSYYIIYEPHVAFAGGTNSEQLKVVNGECKVSNSANVELFSVRVDRLIYYNVEPLDIYITVEDYKSDKTYDGTDIVWSNTEGEPATIGLGLEEYDLSPSIVGYDNILAYDLANYITYEQSLIYEQKTASNNKINIIPSVTLKHKGGNDAMDTIYSIIASYQILSKPRVNGEETELQGYINYRYLDIEILDNPDRITDISDANYSESDYSRSYGEDTYVAFRVAKYNDLDSKGAEVRSKYTKASTYAERLNVSEEEFWQKYSYYADYYYYYDEGTRRSIYCYYSELPEIWNGRNYVFLTIADSGDEDRGLLQGESFKWDSTVNYDDDPSKIFNYNQNTEAEETFIPKNLISWYDVYNPEIEINSLTRSNNDENKNYTLGLAVDDFSITNYKIAACVDKPTFTLEILKIELSPEDVFDFRGVNMDLDRYLKYDGSAHISSICTHDNNTTFISLRNHPEYSDIRKEYNDQFQELLRVVKFSIDYYSDSSLNEEFEGTDLALDAIMNVVWAGTYTFEIKIKETNNYRSVVGYHSVSVDVARVEIYATVAKRTYMPKYDPAEEVKLAPIDASINLTRNELESRRRYINPETGAISDNSASGGEEIYVYFEDNDITNPISTEFIHFYYVGFMGTDTFDGEIGETEATLTFNSPFATDVYGTIDRAGKYDKVGTSNLDVISIAGAHMRNYIFSPHTTALYVIKQSLELVIEPNQTITYTGKYIMPDYEVYNSNADLVNAELAKYVAGYYDVEGNIYIKDYANESSPVIRKAVIASDYDALNEYYFYFYKGGKQTFVYYDGESYFYYEDNDTTNARTYISSFIPNFQLKDGEIYTEYVAILPGLGDDGKMYLVVNEQIEAANKDKQVKDVFYIDGKRGGYILKAYATPPSGGSGNNYVRTDSVQVFINVDLLDIELKDINSETIDGTTINPIVFETYSSTEFAFKDISEYYKGVPEKGNEIEPEYFWGKVEYAVFEGNKQIYYYWDTDNFGETYASTFATAYEKDFKNTNFNKADINTSVINAGVYVILAKVTINDGTQFEDQTVDMTKNIRFATNATQGKFGGEIVESQNANESYFILHLVMHRSNEVDFKALPAGGLVGTDTDSDGIDDFYQKTYDAQEISMGAKLLVLGRESSKGEILNLRAYISPTENERDGEYYFLSNYSFELLDNVEIGALIPKNTYYEKFGLDYKLTEDEVFESGTQYYTRYHYIDNYTVSNVSLVNHNNFYVIYLVNYNDNMTYNNNYTTIRKMYKVNIAQRALDVKIAVKEGEESFKYYGEKNSDVEHKFYFTYENWATTKDKEQLEMDISSPVINWSDVMTENDPEGEYMPCKDEKYQIYAKDAPNNGTYVPAISVNDKSYSNYAFNYNTASIGFEIRKLQLVIGGSEYPRVDISEYGEYQGVGMLPEVVRYGHDGRILDVENGQDSVQTMITLEGKFNDGVYDYQREYTESELLNLPKTKVGSALSVGYYLFKISMPDSINYKGIGTIYWVFEITKSLLTVEFIDDYGQVYRGIREEVYSGNSVIYPTYSIQYTGFLGSDAIMYPSGIKEQISFLHYNDGEHRVTNSALGLINPYYIFIDANTGTELRDTDGNPIMPTERGTYYIRVVYARNVYGFANNYDIRVEYAQEDGDTIYPEFVITARKVTVRYDSMQNTKIVKTYDGTNEVKDGSVSNANYTFTKVTGIVESGLIDGDEIYISVNYLESKYARKTVYDALGVMSDIEVYLLVNSILDGPDYNNYELVIIPTEDNAHVAGGVTYLKLYGTINPASATVRFYKDGQVMTNRITEVYDGLPKPVTVVVTGVNGEVLTIEGGGYSMRYVSELSNYDREEAPSNCDTYVVTVTIIDKNYIPTSNSIDLVIGQAEVEINFGGDGIQVYGDVTVGLSATAISVNNYHKDLTVTYYYYNEDGTQGELIEDISKAPIGVYIVEAIHNETTNYGYKRDTELLTIVRREVQLNYDIANQYKYTGQAVDILMYFIDSTSTYYPQLMFDTIVDGQAIPYNYQLSESGEVANISSRYPIDAGQYRVKAYEEFGNFTITDAIWCDFDIQKADMVVSVADLIIDEGDEIEFTIVLVGNLTSANASSVISGVQYKYYDAITGEELSVEPTLAGEYKVMCHSATSKNYNLNYSFGILKINKVVIETVVQTSNSREEQKQIILEGSFNSKMSVTISKKQNIEYVDMVTTYQSYVENNPDFATYKLSDIYVFEYVNYVPSAIRGNVVVKIHSKDLIELLKHNQKDDESTGGSADEELKFNVALLDATGNFVIVEGYQDGDYVCFETSETQIRAISILVDETITMSDTLDWLLYVGIAVAVLLIGIAIVIVVKRA